MLLFFFPMLVLTIQTVATQPALENIVQQRVQTPSSWKVRIENRDTHSVVAMHLILTCPASAEHSSFGYVYRFDPLYHYGTDQPIPSNGFFGIPFPTAAAECPGGVDAVVFSDGHSTGDSDAVKDIYLRRAGVLAAIDFASPLLEKVAASSLQPAEAAATLKSERNTISKDKAKSVAEREGQMYVFTLISEFLLSQHEWLVPSDFTSHKQPDVAATMASKGLGHEQAHALVLNKQLDEWKSDLQGQLQPPSK